MGLLAASSLWLLLPLGGVILALYLLKLKRRDVTVPATLLWQRITADAQANRPWQKLRPSWLLALQLAALAAISVAAARPFVRATGLAGTDVVLIVDNSASMGATDVSPSRLEAAKERASRLVGELGRGDRLLVISASERTQAVSSLTSDKAALTDAIRSIGQTELPSTMTDALLLASAARRNERPMRVEILTDGSFPPPPEDTVRGLNVTLDIIGTSDNNVAVTAVRSETGNGGRSRGFVRVTNTSSKVRAVTVYVRLGKSLVDARELRLGGGRPEGYAFDLPARASSLLEASIREQDDLLVDNTARAVVGRPARTRVLVVGPGNLFLEQALAVDGSTDVTRARLAPSGDTMQSYDVVIWDRAASGAALGVPEWFIASDSPGSPAVRGTPVGAAPILWRPDAEIRRSADLSDMRSAGFTPLMARPWGRVLADAGGKAIVVAGEKDGVRKISFGWDFLQSDLPLRVSFPILTANTVKWLAGRKEVEGSYKPGDVVPINARADQTNVTVVDPSGRTAQSPPDGQFTGTERAGVYSWKAGRDSGVFAVNLASAEESDLRGDLGRLPRGVKTAQKGTAPRTNREIYQPFLLVALAALTVEWLVFHRRI